APDRGSLCEQSPGAGTLLVAFGPPEVREQAQRALEGCGGSRGLVAKSAGVYANAALFSIERDWTRWRVARPGAGEIEPGPYAEPWPAWPEDGWKLLAHDLGAHMEHGSSGWELTSPASRYAGAAAYSPLVVREGGTYTFSLHYAARSESFAFGVRGSDGGWLVTDTVGVRAALRWVRTCTVKLAAGQQIRVEIANNRDHDGSTRLQIRGLRVAMLTDAH
ncbi:MAG TPA: hypothetical protein VKE70_24150, partial [Candidatus Solibacter sp.]|nr:hypothetical protein [Candidatus Solibacter sp.]